MTDNEFIEIVKNSESISQVIRACGLIPAGGNYVTVKRRMQRLNLDASHFLGQAINRNKQFPERTRPLGDYFSNKFKINSYELKKKIFSAGLKPQICEICQNDSWLGQPIPLELHHKNGNKEDNSLVNLQILCPNCHALTDNYRGKNKNK